ncbi:hypothetical protein HDU98_001572 [Podochytrium sp. JEL0797]|nr:hypothetical protein HDU98_001572 [Podochytrium sp. JEL0797]
MGKVAMTVLTNGLGMYFDELNKSNGDRGGLAITSLWPATAVVGICNGVRLQHHHVLFAEPQPHHVFLVLFALLEPLAAVTKPLDQPVLE